MSTKPDYTVMLVAGETSGDQHAANLFLELKKRLPGVRGIGMGGFNMKLAGIDVEYDSSHIAVIGLVDVITHYAEIRRALKRMQSLLMVNRPDLLICVDYKEFNFKLAGYAKKYGIKVLFYVSPQVWAWRPGRVKKYGRVIDMMAVIFPFERPYYEAHDIPVRYVGHPSVDKVQPRRPKAENLSKFALHKDGPIIGLLPGSRRLEIIRMLPLLLQAAESIHANFPKAQFLLAQAASIDDALLYTYLEKKSVKIKVVKNQPYDLIQCCDSVITMSGTATLEIALLQIPMVIACKVSTMTYWLGKMLIKAPFIGLPNIIAGKSIVKELIQYEATAENIAHEISNILTDSTYNKKIRLELAKIKKEIGSGGGSRAMAELAREMLLQKDKT